MHAKELVYLYSVGKNRADDGTECNTLSSTTAANEVFTTHGW